MTGEDLKLREFESIMNKFSCFIKAHIHKYDIQKDGIDPEDILQDVKLKIWKLLEDEKKINNYPSYIKKIIKSSVVDQLRKSKREEKAYDSELRERISELRRKFSNELHLETNIKEIIGNSVDSLLENRKKVVKLFLLNMTLDEISLLFNWSKDKTRNLLYRGLADLRKKLKEKGINYENK